MFARIKHSMPLGSIRPQHLNSNYGIQNSNCGEDVGPWQAYLVDVDVLVVITIA
jgi:hypothetical protein